MPSLPRWRLVRWKNSACSYARQSFAPFALQNKDACSFSSGFFVSIHVPKVFFKELINSGGSKRARADNCWVTIHWIQALVVLLSPP